MVHVRAAPTACASSEPHEPKHQAWAGSLPTSCNTFRKYTVYVYSYPPRGLQLSDFVGCCQILSDFVHLKARSTRDRSIPRSLQVLRMSFDEILDLTAVVFFHFSIIIRYVFGQKNTQVLIFGKTIYHVGLYV